MQTLIRNGTIHTMSAQGTFQGDVLLDEGRIALVAPLIDVCEADMAHILDAAGLHVCPGLIDAHVHLIRAADHLHTDVRAMAKSALLAGVTTCALWQESGQECIVLHGNDAAAAPGIVHVNAENLREDPLRRVMEDAVRRNLTVGCEVHGEKALKRVLSLRERTGCRVILVHLSQCIDSEEPIAASGCPVILGACCLRGRGSAYELACRLQRRGVTVAITTDYPSTRLHYLPMTAGLCERAGMTTDEALRTITLDAARVLGLEEECGSIERGKRADLIVFDGDPLRFSASRVMTVCGGELV